MQETQVTYSQRYDHARAVAGPASGLLLQDPRRALPEVTLTAEGIDWRPQPDLLNSARSSAVFVLETENDGSSRIRFGDGVMGRRPAPGTAFNADYRVGNGRAGNVGADAIFHVVTDDSQVIGARNPLAARGGIDPEPMERVRLNAPEAFRSQQRAVTEEDYARTAEKHPDVLKAVATRRWTGSWHTMFLAVDRRRGRDVDDTLREKLLNFLDRYRLTGHDLQIEPPSFVPLDIVMKVCVLPGHFQGQVKEALLDQFNNGRTTSGSRGFWHPGNFTFGQAVYVSSITAAAMEVPGVMWVAVERFRRWGKPDLGELQQGRMLMERLQIARLDNDPSAPDNGRMQFNMEGGA